MGKKRKSDNESSDTFKMKLLSNSSQSVLVTFPSGYVPGKVPETLHAFRHAESKKDALILTTVRDVAGKLSKNETRTQNFWC